LRMVKMRPGRAPPLPRGRWCAPGQRLSSGRHPPLSRGQSLQPRWNIPSAEVTFTRRHQRFTRVRPSPQDGWLPPQNREALPLPADLLLACHPRMEQGPLRLRPRASHLAVTHNARRGGDGPTAHWPGYRTTASAALHGASHFTHAPSRRTQPYVASNTTSGASPARAITARRYSGSFEIRTVSKCSPASVILTSTDRRRCKSIPTICLPS
jgi:hypothetical protein